MGSLPLVLISSSPGHTKDLGASTATVCEAGDVIALVGDVGTGKTTFTQGIAEGLGVSSPVTSPTFVLVKLYPGEELDLCHVDLYRLESPEEARSLDLEDCLYGDGVAVIEWADRFPEVLPDEHLLVTICYDGFERRSVRIEGVGRRGREMVEELRAILDGSQWQ